MSVKLAGRLPDEYDHNGMDRLHGELVQFPDRRHVIVLVVDCLRTTIEHGGSDERYTPTVGVIFAEPVTDPVDQRHVLEVLARHRAERTGDATLDLDFGVEDPLARTFRAAGTDMGASAGRGRDR